MMQETDLYKRQELLHQANGTHPGHEYRWLNNRERSEAKAQEGELLVPVAFSCDSYERQIPSYVSVWVKREALSLQVERLYRMRHKASQMFDALTELLPMLELAIEATPTSPTRNERCDLNIKIRALLAEIDSGG